MPQGPPPGRFKLLAPDTQRSLAEFKNGDKRGLWVVGRRRAGSSYAASVAANGLQRRGIDGEYTTARIVMDERHSLWDGKRELTKSWDDELALAIYDIEQHLARLWDAGWLWIDDLHSHLDMRMWMKHVQPQVEERIKGGGYTLVATDMAPNHPAISHWEPVIADLFVVAHATR